MNKILQRTLLAALLAGGSITAMAFVAPSVQAAEEEVAEDAIDTEEFSRDFRETYSDAVEAFQENMDIPAAHAILAEARATELSPGARYTLESLDFQLFLQEQNLEAGTVAFNAAYDTGIMPRADKVKFMRIATILNQSDHPRAIMYGLEGQNYPGWDAPADQVLVNAFYFSGDLAGAEQQAQSVIARKEAAGETPTFDILNVLYFSQSEQGKEVEAALTADRIAVIQPTSENWERVITNAFTAPNLQERHYLNLYRLRHKVTEMQAADYKYIVEAAAQLGLPAEAKVIFEEAISKGLLQESDVGISLADIDALVAETEASLDAFGAEAAAATTGQEEVQYGELLFSYGRAADAEAAIQRGIQKGGLTNPTDAQLLLGIVQLEQGKKVEARQSFEQAEQDAVMRPVAHAWNLYSQI
ncbi:MAG: hypothetical protein ACKVG0_02850 [Alphaproteobacteria bacterium]